MPRFFAEAENISDDKIIIRGTDVNHIKNVLRMQQGESLEICDGNGTDYSCVIESLEREEIILNVEASQPSASELKKRIYLFQGLPKSDKMELIIQKAVELGVYEIIPTVTKRCIVKIDAKKEDKKIARWQGIAESAAKQSGRGIIPQVKTPMSLKEAYEYAAKLGAALIPYEKAEGIEKTREYIASLADKDNIAVFIGPEGGFEESEIEEAVERGIMPITLGRRILRTETAGLTILSVLMMTYEE